MHEHIDLFRIFSMFCAGLDIYMCKNFHLFFPSALFGRGRLWLFLVFLGSKNATVLAGLGS